MHGLKVFVFLRDGREILHNVTSIDWVDVYGDIVIRSYFWDEGVTYPSGKVARFEVEEEAEIASDFHS